jgi:membrane-associated phospholipid phosphatase
MLTRDTRAVASLSLSPWTRDVGQMVQSPGDLYELTENDVLQMHDRDGLSGLGDMDDDYTLPELGSSTRPWPDFVGEDASAAGDISGRVEWWRTALIAGGITLASSALDTRASRYASEHQDARWMKDGIRIGDALPVAALGISGLFALDDSRPRLSDAGIAALEAGAAGLVLSEGLKYGVGRARPSADLGKAAFNSGSREDRYHSFPSNHTVLMWAAVTPYAEEFDAPWLYGVAAVTNLARIGSRKHWVSDTVAGSLIGYGLGYLAWDARRRERLDKHGPTVLLGPNSVNLAWSLD